MESHMVTLVGRTNAPRTEASDEAVPIRVAIASEQVSAEVAVGLGPSWIVAIRQMPGYGLQSTSRIEFLATVNNCPPAQPWLNIARRRPVVPIRIGRPALDGCSVCRSPRAYA
jgi:hypothetical protein